MAFSHTQGLKRRTSQSRGHGLASKGEASGKQGKHGGSKWERARGASRVLRPRVDTRARDVGFGHAVGVERHHPVRGEARGVVGDRLHVRRDRHVAHRGEGGGISHLAVGTVGADARDAREHVADVVLARPLPVVDHGETGVLLRLRMDGRRRQASEGESRRRQKAIGGRNEGEPRVRGAMLREL